MLLMANSLMMIIIMIFYPNLSKGVLKLSWILNNNRLPVNAVESSDDPYCIKVDTRKYFYIYNLTTR